MTVKYVYLQTCSITVATFDSTVRTPPLEPTAIKEKLDDRQPWACRPVTFEVRIH